MISKSSDPFKPILKRIRNWNSWLNKADWNFNPAKPWVRRNYWNILQILNRKVGVLTMSLPKKMDQKTANEIRSILTKMNITQSKVKINLDNQTIEVEDDYSIDDILESAGVLTPEQAKQLADEVKKMREEEWN